MKSLIDFFCKKNKKEIIIIIPIFLILVAIGWLMECGILKIITILFNGTFNLGMATIVFFIHFALNILKVCITQKFKKHRT